MGCSPQDRLLNRSNGGAAGASRGRRPPGQRYQLASISPRGGRPSKIEAMPASASDLTTPVLLLAMPQVLDPYFERSVVLLVHHEEAGSLGFVLNHPTAIRVGEILKEMDLRWAGRPEIVAYRGGPVQPELGTVLFAPVLAET